jgi:hypothetical protein
MHNNLHARLGFERRVSVLYPDAQNLFRRYVHPAGPGFAQSQLKQIPHINRRAATGL